MKHKYPVIDFDDIQEFDIVYYYAMQRTNDVEPIKPRPFLVNKREGDTLDLVPITHTDPADKGYHDLYSFYNTLINPNLDNKLKKMDHDYRDGFFDVAGMLHLSKDTFEKSGQKMELKLSNRKYATNDVKAGISKDITDKEKEMIKDNVEGDLPDDKLCRLNICHDINPDDYPIYDDNLYPAPQTVLNDTHYNKRNKRQKSKKIFNLPKFASVPKEDIQEEEKQM